MKAASVMLLLAALAAGGCSGAPSLTTASLFGSDEKPAAPTVVNDPPMRAYQVGTVSARAIKCGFNFDPAKLKASYLMYESQQPGGADLAKLEKIYDVSFNGVAKAVASQTSYCTPTKTKKIKAELTRHLAGDYTPSPPEPKQEEEGLFSGWGTDGSESSDGVRSTISTNNDDI